jgi:transposase
MKRKHEAETIIREKYEALSARLDERSRRLWAATEARAVGYGGVAAVARATGMSRNTVKAGLADLERGDLDVARVRRPGAGRKSRTEEQPDLLEALQRLIDPLTRGDPESPLRWTTKSAAKLADALKAAEFEISSSTVWRLLRDLGYRLQSTKKTLERRHHDDRDAQFIYIDGAVRDVQAAGDPSISVDTKKKELIGDFQNGGREWHPSGRPPLVLSHDFPSDAEGRAIPYGVYDIERNEALVNVGIDHDTSAFAVESIRRWWFHLGKQAYPDSTQLLVTADAGGSNGYRRRAWKKELQALATETGLTIHVVHFPPGTSKWNKIEHRLFCHLSKNWRGQPLYNYATAIQLIGSTTTKTGLSVKALLDDGDYPTGIRIDPRELDTLNITKSVWHGEWNYSIAPAAS